jgi:hypothetical protein
MSETISLSEQNYKRSLDLNSKFLIIGNNIDGYVNIDIEEFDNFEDLKHKLPGLLTKINCSGEWDLKLFQIAKTYKIIKKYGYYKTPSHGKLIFAHNYMDYPIKSVKFETNKIQVIGSSLEIVENWKAKSNEDFLNYEIDIEVKNIMYS